MTSTEMTVGDQWSQCLTRREQQVALLIVRGLSNKEVARELGLSYGTVKLHVHRIFQKTGVRNRYSLIIQMNDHNAGRLQPGIALRPRGECAQSAGSIPRPR